jgi:ornithine carbamoyltransferase
MTLEEEFGRLKGLKLVFVGDGRNNMARALVIGCSKMGVHDTIVAPQELHPDEALQSQCIAYARASGARIHIGTSPREELEGADAVYTDVWVSMGEEEKSAERMRLLRPFQVDSHLMALTGRRDTIFLHCLPAVKGNEVSFEVIEGSQSRVWDEAESRKHTIKALMLATL